MVFGPTVYDVPLLPFEKELIATVGITEEEYRHFVAEAKRRGAIRPAAYDHIPDIQNGAATPILINVAVSLVLTGVAYLLTPKPKMAGAKSAGGTVNLESLTGSQRFTPSRGFETVNELADYGAPIPVIFGLYKDGVGGMLTTPKLVWSRMFSQGTLQRAKLMFVVGEQGNALGRGLKAPDLEGIFLGNNALDVAFKDFFAFYWKRDSSTEHRIAGNNKVYGSQNSPASGAPDIENSTSDAFTAPTPNGDSPAFCHAYSPANNTQFGVYASIANGTSYRVNYRVVSVPDDQSKKAKAVLMLERMKIVGDFGAKKPLRDEKITPGKAAEDSDRVKDILRLNQQGIGRNYSPRMGVAELRRNGRTLATTPSNKIRLFVENVQLGDEAVFIMSTTEIPDDYYQRGDGRGTSVSDINSTVKQFQLQADEALQLGEQFESGGMIWKVKKRKLAQFDPDGSVNQKIILECVDDSGSSANKMGIVSEDKVIRPNGERVYIGDGGPGARQANIPEPWYPFTRVAVGVIRNNRTVVATEIGLKSTVFQRLNGICNFMSLPSSPEIEENDKDNIQFNSGTSTLTIKRSSVFRVFIRQVKEDGSTTSFESFPLYFVVRGQSPTAQYNFLRFSTDSALQLEYKFMPCSGSDLKGSIPSYDYVILSASGTTEGAANGQNGIFSRSANLKVGEVSVTGGGAIINPSIGRLAIESNAEFIRNPKPVTGSGATDYPSKVRWYSALPDPVFRDKASTIIKDRNVANEGVTAGKLGAFFYHLHGSAEGIPTGEVKNFQTIEYMHDDRKRWINIRWTISVHKYDKNLPSYSGEKKTWVIEKIEVIDSGGDFRIGDVFDVTRGSRDTSLIPSTDGTSYPESNPYKRGGPNDQNIKYSGISVKVTGILPDQGMAARSQAFRWEIFGSVNEARFNTGEPAPPLTVTLSKDGGDKTLKVDLTSKPVEFDTRVVGRKYGWSRPLVTKIYEDENTTQNWIKEEKVGIKRNVSASNPFYTFFDNVGQQYIIDAIGEEVDPTYIDTSDDESLAFSSVTQTSDISFYRDLVEKSNSREPEHEIVYVNEIQENDETPKMTNLVLAGLSLKASRNFTRLDQLRCWMGQGLSVKRLHPDRATAYGDSAQYGPSNLLTDLVFYLLTDVIGGAGGLLGMHPDHAYLVDTNALKSTSRFLEKQKLFFNGPIVERTNLRQFITDVAPNFLCNFVITDGKFSLQPALPFNASTGEFNTGAIQIEQLFTAGNILEDSYKLEYLSAEERRHFKALVRFRQERKNRLPEEKVINVKGVNGDGLWADNGVSALPQEQFDLTQFCTTEDHAFMVAKYFLALRAYVKHTIRFSTTVEGLNIKAGSFIKVVTESSPYSAAKNGSINASGKVTSVDDLPDGTYTVDYYKSGDEEIEGPVSMRISGNAVADSEFHDSVFTVRNSSVSQNIYVVEQLTFSEEGTVDIVASEHPCDDQGRSLIVQTILNDTMFRKR